jgi:hypothetical protein
LIHFYKRVCFKMAPQPTKNQVELDMERKEELIIAKQLRACRVNILPRGTLETFGHQKKVQKQIPGGFKKHLDIPKPKVEHVEKASNPIALRYWNQCLSGGGSSGDASPNRSSDASPSFEAREFKIEDLPWVSKTPEPEPSPKIVQPKQKISVPDIRRKMTPTPEPTLKQEIRASSDQFAFNFTGVSTYDSSVQRNFFSDKEKPPPLPAKTSAHKGSASQFCYNQTGVTKSSKQSTVIVDKVLSTAGQGILRDNEKQEAKLNINRFITIGMLKSAGDSKPADKLTASTGGDGGVAASKGATNNQTRKVGGDDTATEYNRYDSGISSFSSDDSDSDADNNREGGQSSSTLQNSSNSTINKGGENGILEPDMVATYLDSCPHKELNMSVIQKLTSQRKNSIGMLFYKEMTEELIKEILAQVTQIIFNL